MQEQHRARSLAVSVGFTGVSHVDDDVSNFTAGSQLAAGFWGFVEKG